VEAVILFFQRIDFNAESARSNHIGGEFTRQIPAFDDPVFGYYLVHVALEVLRTVQQQVKHVLQLSGREDGRKPRS